MLDYLAPTCVFSVPFEAGPALPGVPGSGRFPSEWVGRN